MLYLALAYLIISSVCLWAGWLFYQVIPGRPGPFTDGKMEVIRGQYERPVVVYLLTGLMLLTGVGQCLVIFHPLDGMSLLIVVLLLVLLTIAGRRHWRSLFLIFASGSEVRSGRSKYLLFIIAALALFCMILVLNAGPTIMDDTDSYHIQMIKWAQEYGTVPGIANLHLRFGFNSSWFIAVALLCPQIKGIDHYLVLNGLLSCWFCYYFLEKIYRSFSLVAWSPAIASCFLLAAALLIWPLVRGNAASANYDFISTFCILVLLVESTTASRPMLWQEWMIWPCFLLTIRITNVPILLLSLIAFLYYIRHIKRIPWSCLILAIFFLLPFVARNFILSGYPLFPLYQFTPFAPDWKADPRELVQIMDYIKYFNRSSGNPELVRGLSFPRWLWPWFQQLYPYNKVLVSLSLLSWIGVGLRWKKWTRYQTPVCRGLVLTLALSVVVWIFLAPDPRFNYGALLAGPFLFIFFYRQPGISSFPIWMKTAINRKIIGFLLLCAPLCIFLYSALKIRNDPAYRNLVKPHPLPLPEYRIVKVDGIDLRIPEKVLDNWNPRCYGLPLPCLYRVNPRLHSRGNSLRDGFRLEGPVRGINPGLPIGPDNPPEDDGEYKTK